LGQYDLFRKIAQSNLTAKEREVNQIKYDLLADFEDSPSYVLATRNGTEQGFHIVDENAINKSPDKKRVLCKPNESIAVGDLIVWDGNNWLCVDIDGDDTVQMKGLIQQSTHSLTINKNGNPSEVPIVIESAVRLYSLGQDSTKYNNTLSDEIIVYTPSSANIEVDDVYKIGKRNYKVMTVQDVLIDGLLVVKMEVTVEEVKEVEEPIEPPATGLFISPTDNFIYRNKTKVFTAKIFNNEVEDIVSRTIWLITNKDGTYNRYCEMTYDNRNCTLTASNESSHVGKIVILRLALESDSSVYVEQEVTIKSLV